MTAAKETQDLCQQLNVLSRHKPIYANKLPNESYTSLLDQLKTKKAALEKGMNEAKENSPERHIYQEALQLLHGTAHVVKERIAAQSPPLFSFPSTKEAFRSQRRELENKLEAMIPQGTTPSILRLNLSGRVVHHRQISALKDQLVTAEREMSALLKTMAAGTWSPDDTKRVATLQARLDQLKSLHENLQVTYGKAAPGTQFVQRAALQASISALESNVIALQTFAETDAGQAFSQSTTIVGQLSIALHAKGQKQATAFYEACQQLHDLEEKLSAYEKKPPVNSLIQRMLDDKVSQLRAQLQNAAASIGEKERDKELKSVDKWARSPQGVGMSSKDRQQALSFLTKAMTLLTLFDLPEDQKLLLQAKVDLCLRQMSEDGRAQLPEKLTKSYTSLPSNSPDWSNKIEAAGKFLEEYSQLVQKERPTQGDLNNIFACYQRLAHFQTKLPTEVYSIIDQQRIELTEDHFVELTPQEEAFVKSIPDKPKPEQQRAIESALSKLMLQVLYGPEGSRQSAFIKLQTILQHMGANVDYQPLIDRLRAQPLLSTFLKSVFTQNKDTVSKETDIEALLTKYPWATQLIDLDMLPGTEKLSPTGKQALEAQIQQRKDLALLEENRALIAPPRWWQASPHVSWQRAARLKLAFDRCETRGSFAPPNEQLGVDYRENLDAYMNRSLLTPHKKETAEAAIQHAQAPATPATQRYQQRILDVSEEKRVNRTYQMLGPILIQAIKIPPGNNPARTSVAKNTLTTYQFSSLLNVMHETDKNLQDPTFRTLLAEVFRRLPEVSEVLSDKEALTKLATKNFGLEATDPLITDLINRTWSPPPSAAAPARRSSSPAVVAGKTPPSPPPVELSRKEPAAKPVAEEAAVEGTAAGEVEQPEIPPPPVPRDKSRVARPRSQDISPAVSPALEEPEPEADEGEDLPKEAVETPVVTAKPPPVKQEATPPAPGSMAALLQAGAKRLRATGKSATAGAEGGRAESHLKAVNEKLTAAFGPEIAALGLPGLLQAMIERKKELGMTDEQAGLIGTFVTEHLSGKKTEEAPQEQGMGALLIGAMGQRRGKVKALSAGQAVEQLQDAVQRLLSSGDTQDLQLIEQTITFLEKTVPDQLKGIQQQLQTSKSCQEKLKALADRVPPKLSTEYRLLSQKTVLSEEHVSEFTELLDRYEKAEQEREQLSNEVIDLTGQYKVLFSQTDIDEFRSSPEGSGSQYLERLEEKVRELKAVRDLMTSLQLLENETQLKSIAETFPQVAKLSEEWGKKLKGEKKIPEKDRTLLRETLEALRAAASIAADRDLALSIQRLGPLEIPEMAMQAFSSILSEILQAKAEIQKLTQERDQETVLTKRELIRSRIKTAEKALEEKVRKLEIYKPSSTRYVTGKNLEQQMLARQKDDSSEGPPSDDDEWDD